MTRVRFGNVWARLEDASLQDEAATRQRLTYRVEGYQFTSAYKRGTWDGRKTLYNIAGRTFPAGLAYEIGQLLGATVEDDRGPAPLPDPYLTVRRLGVDLMPHQDAAVTRIQQRSRGVIHHPVGAGKSVVIVEAVRRLGVPALVLVTKKELLHQLHKQFTTLLGKEGIGMLGDGVVRPDYVTVATIQTIAHALNAGKGPRGSIDQQGLAKRQQMLDLLAHFKGVHIDECHHLPAQSFTLLLRNLPNAYYRVGYSATPMRSGQEEQRLLVTGLTGPVISQLTMEDNVDIGRGVRAGVYMIDPGGAPPDDYSEDEGWFDRRGNWHAKRSYPRAVETGIIRHPDRNAKIVKLAGTFGPLGPTLVLTERIEHGMLIRDMLTEAGHKEVR